MQEATIKRSSAPILLARGPCRALMRVKTSLLRDSGFPCLIRPKVKRIKVFFLIACIFLFESVFMHAKEKTMKKKSGNSTLVNLGHFHINQRSFSSLVCMGIKIKMRPTKGLTIRKMNWKQFYWNLHCEIGRTMNVNLLLVYIVLTKFQSFGVSCLKQKLD